MHKIIGLSGTNGSGKDTIARMLIERHDFLFADATEMFMAELKQRNWPLDRVHKAKLSAEWRRQSGMAAIVDKGMRMFEQSYGKYQGVVIGSLRHPGEADRIHELGGTLVWADGDSKMRYERLIANAHARGRAVEDDKTFEEFLEDEKREMHPIGDEATLNMAAVRERADVTILNNGDDILAFKDQAEKALGFVT